MTFENCVLHLRENILLVFKKLKITSVLVLSIFILGFSNIKTNVSINPLSSLFKIERSKDNNQIFYDVNITDSGVLNNKTPINVYWRRNTEGGVIKPLTWIQQKYAYGLNFINVNEDSATFRFVSYKKLFFTLKKTKDNHFEVYTKCNNQILKMNRIFIKIEGGSFWFPNITAVEIHAKNIKTGKDVVEIITP